MTLVLLLAAIVGPTLALALVLAAFMALTANDDEGERP